MNEIVEVAPPDAKKKVDKNLSKLNIFIPQPPFTVGIIGPRFRGKTVLLKHLISKARGMYGNYFDRDNIILYSPTYDFDDTLHSLKLKNVLSPPTDMKNVLHDIREQQEEYRKNNNIAPVLLVMEDITQFKNAWHVLEELGYTGRHFHIHTLAIGHKLSSIPRGVRTQMQQWILFKPNEQSEWQWILDMFSRKKTQRIWSEALKRCWDIQFNFAYIDFERQEFNLIYRSGFNNPLFTEDEQKQMEDIYYNPELKKERLEKKPKRVVKEESNH